jgi:hypothetical protein
MTTTELQEREQLKALLEKYPDAKPGVYDAEYSSEWDDGYTLTTKCKYDPTLKLCFDIEDSGEAPDGSLTDEWVTFEDKDLRESDGVRFDY